MNDDEIENKSIGKTLPYATTPVAVVGLVEPWVLEGGAFRWWTAYPSPGHWTTLLRRDMMGWIEERGAKYIDNLVKCLRPPTEGERAL